MEIMHVNRITTLYNRCRACMIDMLYSGVTANGLYSWKRYAIPYEYRLTLAEAVPTTVLVEKATPHSLSSFLSSSWSPPPNSEFSLLAQWYVSLFLCSFSARRRGISVGDMRARTVAWHNRDSFAA